jgi:hypothetical protein
MAKQPLTEVDAMKVVDDALGGLETEARNRVLAWAASKYHAELQQPGGGTGTGNGEKGTAQESGGGSLGHIKDFVVKKQPNTLYERVACLAYYLEKSKGMTAFNAKDVEKANTDARQGKIDNPASVLSDATRKYGFLAQVGGGKKALTAKGEALVEALPDREKAKEALKKHRRRVRKSRKTKK